MKITDEAFQSWWGSSKYCQVIDPQANLYHAARDGFRAGVSSIPRPATTDRNVEIANLIVEQTYSERMEMAKYIFDEHV